MHGPRSEVRPKGLISAPAIHPHRRTDRHHRYYSRYCSCELSVKYDSDRSRGWSARNERSLIHCCSIVGRLIGIDWSFWQIMFPKSPCNQREQETRSCQSVNYWLVVIDFDVVLWQMDEWKDSINSYGLVEFGVEYQMHCSIKQDC